MAQQTELAISLRQVTGKANKRLRKSGFIPANIFGHNEPPVAVQVDAVEYENLRRAHRTTSILSLRRSDGDGVETVLVRHVEREPRTGKVLHIDFFRVSLTERINVKIALQFIGDAPGVKNENGVLLHLLDALEVECPAGELVEHLDVDVSSLEHIDDIIHASAIKLPANFTLLTDPEEGVAKVAATRAEKAEEAEEAAAASAETPAAPTAEGENSAS